MYERRDVHPHSRNHHKLSLLSIWPDPVPLVRLLLTCVIPDKPVRCKASITFNVFEKVPAAKDVVGLSLPLTIVVVLTIIDELGELRSLSSISLSLSDILFLGVCSF
jgi:hypothetical protein